MVKIALAHPYSWPEVRRGGERVLHDLAWTLRNLDHRVEIITGTPGSSHADLVEEVPVTRVRHHDTLDRRGVGRYETFGLDAFPWLVRHRFDLVVAMAPTAAVAARLAGHRTIFATMGWPTAQYWSDRPVEAKAFRLAARLSHSVTVLSTAAADSVQQLTGVRPVVLPAGVRADAFAPKLGVRRGPPVVLFASWAEERGKGLDLLVRAFARLSADVPGARLWLAGGGDHSWALEGLNAVDRRCVVGAIDVVADQRTPISSEIYSAAHVTALPSQMESFGLVLLESLSCGTPVVGSATGGILDVAAGCQAARLAPHGDVDALRIALQDAIVLASRPGTAQAARGHAERFDWLTSIGPRHVTFYEAVAARSRWDRPRAPMPSPP